MDSVYYFALYISLGASDQIKHKPLLSYKGLILYTLFGKILIKIIVMPFFQNVTFLLKQKCHSLQIVAFSKNKKNKTKRRNDEINKNGNVILQAYIIHCCSFFMCNLLFSDIQNTYKLQALHRPFILHYTLISVAFSTPTSYVCYNAIINIDFSIKQKKILKSYSSKTSGTINVVTYILACYYLKDLQCKLTM